MSSPLWTVELHSHTRYSKDCLIRPDNIQMICQEKELDRIAITDHNTAQGALELARLFPMLIIPGEEIMTTKGELLAWYIQESVPPGLSPKETIQRLREQGAVVGISHPLDRYRRGAWKMQDLLEIVGLVDTVEVFNSRCILNEDNSRALAFAQEHGKLMTCGSDAHLRREFGRAVMKMQPFSNTANGLLQALKNATRQETLSGAGVHFGSTLAKWLKRLNPSLRLS